jgi:hypothetical protein
MHESLTVTEFTVKENEGFRLRVKGWECLSPKDVYAIEFINECMTDGKVDYASTYNFFLTKEEIAKLCQSLLNVK